MAFNIQNKLVIAVASSALFDLQESDRIYRERGVEEYREYQRQNQRIAFKPGVAFPFISRFLGLSDLNPSDPPVEVILTSKNDPDTGLRVFNSIREYKLNISRGAFLSGKSPFSYLDAFNASLFLSGNREDVRRAIEAEKPAGLVLGSPLKDDPADRELRVAFDFDGVLADDEAEKVYDSTNDVNAFHSAEQAKVDVPHKAGPLGKLYKEFSALQHDVPGEAQNDKHNRPRIRIAIITARNAPSHERVVTTLRTWGVQPDETFFLGGIEKTRILEVFRPHMFFDDQLRHLEGGSAYGAMVHVPFGVKNVLVKQSEQRSEEKHLRIPLPTPGLKELLPK
jgi:5'-nucleotidase